MEKYCGQSSWGKMDKRSNHKRTIGYILAFIVPCLFMTMILYLQRAIPFGKATFLYGDAYNQYYAVFREMLRWLKDPQRSLILWDRGLGVDFYANMLYYGLSPFNVILVVMGEEGLELSMTVVTVLKMACIGVTTYYFFLHTGCPAGQDGTNKKHFLVSLAASLAFSLSGFVLAYNHNLMWLDGLILLPLLALAIERLVTEGKWRAFVILLVLTMVTNFYFAVYICFFCFLYFLLQDFDGKFLKCFLKFAGAAVLATLIASVVLIPAFYAVLSRGNYDDSFSISRIPAIGELWKFFGTFNPLSDLDGLGKSIYTYNNFCGCIVLFLLCLFFTEKKIPVKRKVKYGIVVLFLTIATNLKICSYVLHGFSYPHGMGNRFAFILVFLLIIMSVETICTMEQLSQRRTVFLCLFWGIYTVVGMVLNSGVSYVGLLICMVLYGSFAVLFSKNSIRLSAFRTCITAVWILEVTANCFYAALPKYSPSTFREETGYEQYRDYYDGITTKTGERKTVLSGESFMSVSETDWYSSVLNGNALDAFQSLGLSNYEVAEITYRGTTPLTALLFNVRYVLTNEWGMHGGYREAGSEAENFKVVQDDTEIILKLYEAENPMGFGYMVSKDVLDWKGNRDPFENQNELMHKFLSDSAYGDIFTKADVEYQGDTTLFMDVNGKKEQTYDYTSTMLLPPMFTVQYVANSDMDLYMWSKDNRYRTINAYVDEELRVLSCYTDNASVAHIGEVKKGQTILLRFFSGADMGEEGFMEYSLYSFHEDAFLEALPELKDEVLQIDDMGGGGISGHIDVEQDGVLYLALPYSKGYKVTADGIVIPVHKIGTGLMGVELEAGTHEIEITYCTPGLHTGIVCSIVGLICFLLLSLIPQKSKNDIQENALCFENE